MPLLLFIMLNIIFLALYKNKQTLSYSLFGIFLVLWLAIFIPHIIHHVANVSF